MGSAKLNIAIILGSTREERMCDRVAKFVQDAIGEKHVITLFDPLELKFPKTQQSMNWFMNPSDVPDNIKDLNNKMVQCDAIVVVTPEYNQSLPPALAEIVDNIPPYTFVWKPCAIISYSVGQFGGCRGASQVRHLMGAVGCTVTQKQMGIPLVHQSLDKDGKTDNEKLGSELTTTLEQLYWLTRAINSHKLVEAPPVFSI